MTPQVTGKKCPDGVVMLPETIPPLPFVMALNLEVGPGGFMCPYCRSVGIGPEVPRSCRLVDLKTKLLKCVFQLVKTHNLLPSHNYIFGYHPHGILAIGAFCNFGTEATGVSKKFPGIKPYLVALAGYFRMPVVREYFISAGLCPVSRQSIDYILSKNGTGNAVVIVIGGTAECLDCQSGKNSVTLKQRKGFVKIALQHGANLVPVYSFGENKAYKQILFEEDSWGLWLQRKFQKNVGIAPCLFYGCGFFSTDTWGFVPYPTPITTVVGEPIAVPKMEQPTQKDVDLYHSMYLTSLQKLFDKYKTEFGLSESDVLEII
ncbi:diacylglycerol O-acyltransferase 2-like [Bufo bufo]|uniref:diacylglycerol O-acyltransferase 2-like n=1 Tax=Bufo bufo TaxID=8384 RepID=UPI001ABEDEE6|nr:diacylglycerol O-acyltransferase 2-like [Bufo bufo]